METALSLDTSFLIDLQRERHRGKPGAAYAVLENHQEASLWCSVVAWGELLEGLTGGVTHPVAVFMRRRMEIRPLNEPVAETYSRLVADLRSKGRVIGANDCWIGAAAVESGHALVTRNGAEFRRIPELRVISY